MEGDKKVITVVCTGNVCRSPMAERLLQHALDAEEGPLKEIQVISAGVSAFPGDPASNNAVKALSSVNLDLSDHRSRPLSDQVIEVSDLILAMTQGHVDIIKHQHPDSTVPVFRFREWIASGPKEVPDPFCGPLELYKDTRDSLAEAVPSIINFLKSQQQ
ncbi:MAG: low molecular weight protein arginine phosphatase [Puniceicoccaceae bacterium]